MSMRMVSGAAVMLVALGATGAMAQERDVVAMVQAAEAAGRAGLARKTSLVDARPAIAGEVVVTMILGQGKETQSKPAQAGDWVVRNRCPATGNEEYLVKATRFAERYQPSPGEPDQAGWRAFRPTGKSLRYVTVTDGDGSFSFTAPWGERMLALPGDAIVQDLAQISDTYRVAAASFACTYDVVTPVR